MTKYHFPVPQIVDVLDELYTGINAKQISLQERQRLGIQDEAFVYGEMIFETFPQILHVAKPQPGEVFYDLGCGAGKAVFSAALFHDFSKVTGVEYLTPLYQLCLNQLTKFQQSAAVKKLFPQRKFNITFIHGDLFDQDLSDADIVYSNATCFIGETWRRMIKKLESLKTGARIIISTKHLHDATQFRELHTNLYPMSWGDCTVSVYQKM